MFSVKLIKNVSLCALGFGIGGFFWGLLLYNALPDLEFVFHYQSIMVLGLFGGIGLGLAVGGFKEIAKAITAGWLGLGVGFLVMFILAAIFFYSGILLISSYLFYFIDTDFSNYYLNIRPDIQIGDFWILFLSIGFFVSLFYSFFLKLKKWPFIWRGSIGLAIASILGPVIGNLISNPFNNLLVNYLVVFSLVGIIFGKFVGWAVTASQKQQD